MLGIIALLLGAAAAAEGVLIVVDVVPVVNGAGEAITSVFWRMFFAVFAFVFGLCLAGAGVRAFSKGIPADATSAEHEREGTYVEVDVVDDLIDF